MANVIYRGPVEREPETINLPVSATLSPGVFVKKNAGQLEAAGGSTGRLMVLSNRRFMETDITTAYAVDETAIAYRVEPEQEYQMLAATGNYADQVELSCSADGKLKVAVTGEVVLAFVDGAKNLAAEGFLDVVISNGYVKA